MAHSAIPVPLSFSPDSIKMTSKIKISLIFSFILCSQFLFAQQNKGKQVIPFQLTAHNNLSIQAILNGKDTLNLMLHTAANALAITEEGIQKMKNIQFERTDTVKSWGGGNTSRFSASNSLQIGALYWEKLPIWEDKNSGPSTDGKCGLNLFENKVIEIDYDKKQLVIYDQLPKHVKNYEKLKLSFENELLFVEGNCVIGNQTYPNKFLIHSGYAGTILLDDQFVANNNIDGQLTVVGVKELKDSFGNSIKTKKAILPSLLFGKQKLTAIPVGFFEGAIGRQKMSLIGGDVLKRFNIIIDAKRQYIYLKANQLHQSAYTNV